MNNMSYTISVKDKITNSAYNNFIFNHENHKIEVSLTGNYKDTYRAIVRWNFGDGTYAEGSSVTHYYKQAGKYKVSAVLYDLDRTPYDNLVSPVEILVREIVPTEISFYSGWDGPYYFSKNNKLGEILITVGNEFVKDPQINPIRKWEKPGKTENSYFDIKNESFYHLKKYYTFLTKDYIRSIDEKSSTAILRPTESYKPSYKTFYGKINKDKSLELYYVKTNINDTDIKVKLYINADGNRKNYTIKAIQKLNDVPADCYPVGKFALLPIYYKNDYNNFNTNRIFFEIDKKTLKFKNEEALDESYLNIAPIVFDVNLSQSPDAFKALTSNGLCTLLPSDNVEKHLKHNFYKNHEVEAYYSYFVPNDTVEDDMLPTYNMDKTRFIESNLTSSDNKCDITYVNNKIDYYKSYHLKPLEDEFELLDNGEIFYKHNTLKDLNTITLPSEKVYEQNVDELLKAYMSHPMYDNAVNLKTMLKNIFENRNMLSYITSKGINFIDDHVNHKSCYIKELLSLFELLDEPLKQYDISAFEKINELKELTRIMSMNYSQLFGTEIKNEYDIQITPSSKGKNVADQLEYNDSIICDKDYNIIGFRRGTKINKLLKPTQYIVVKDDFTFRTYLVNLYGVSTYEIEDFNDQSEEWKIKNSDLINESKYVYRLSDYNYKWGWGLNLPEEVTNRQDRDYLIDGYYTFYLFNPEIKSERKYNFLDEKTIPLIDGEQISVEKWEEDFGFLYDCLVKVLTDNLNLK